MNDVPKGAARNPESDGDPARIGDIQNSAKWEDRLAQARIRRAAVLAERDQAGGPDAGNDDLQKIANLNARLAMVPGRGKMVRDKSAVNPEPVADLQGEREQDSYQKTVLVALTGAQAKQNDDLRRDSTPVTALALPVQQDAAPSERPKRRAGVVYLAAAVVFALLIAVALPGQFRDVTIRSVNQVTGLFAGTPVDTANTENAGTIAANAAPPALDAESLATGAGRDNDSAASLVDQAVLVPGDGLTPGITPEVSLVAATLASASPDNSDDGALQVSAGFDGSVNKSLQVANLSGALSDSLPTQSQTAPVARRTGETAAVAAVPETANITTDSTFPVADAPAVMVAVAALPGMSEVLTSDAPLQTAINASSTVKTVLAAANLSDPSVVDTVVPVPGPDTPLRIVSNYPATTAFAAAIGSINLDALAPGPFQELSPIVVAVSVPQATAPGDAPAAQGSPEPRLTSLAVTPIARPGSAADAVDNGAAAAVIAGFDVRVHAPLSWPEGKLNELTAALRDTGYSIRTPVRVNFNISGDNVRYFHASDAEAARVLSAVVGGQVRDFTTYAPSPPVGTVEIWLAGNSPLRNVARPSAPAAKPSGSQDLALLFLRNQLVESLRRGDHL